MEKEIQGYPGYLVTDTGDIISTERRWKTRTGELYIVPRRHVIQQGKFWTGYKKVSINNASGKRDTLSVHRLVAKAFVPNPENKPQVNHIDGNKENNNASNLEWVTHGENSRHAVKLGLQKGKPGESHPLSKVTEAEVIEMITDMKNGASNKDLGLKYKLNPNYISLIRSKKRWKNTWDKIEYQS